jgi:general stress protein 26
MILMPKEALEFLRTQRVGVFAIRMLDGTPHGATVHFAHMEDSLTFIFLTTPTYRKLEPMRKGESAASFVVGTSEDVMKTLQMDGNAKLEDTEELRRVYFAKFAEKLGKHPEDVLFTFTPTWWRYTDWTLPAGKTIFTSEAVQ